MATARPAPKVLWILSLLGIGGWAALTVLVGLSGVANAVRDYRELHDGVAFESLGPVGSHGSPDLLIGISVAMMLAWVLSMSFVVVGGALGVAYVIVRFRSWARAIGLGVASFAAPVGALWVDRALVSDGDPFIASGMWHQVVVCGAIAVIGVLLLVAAMSLMGLWSRHGRAAGASA
ncbi:MAG: hypothetical protein FWD95_00140 [Nocardioidaceae bacterium]|nr:hypothetical protein [Nocardioidaceae bacterium]